MRDMPNFHSINVVIVGYNGIQRILSEDHRDKREAVLINQFAEELQALASTSGNPEQERPLILKYPSNFEVIITFLVLTLLFLRCLEQIQIHWGKIPFFALLCFLKSIFCIKFQSLFCIF